MEDLQALYCKNVNKLPSVGIGLPVYNNVKFISNTLDSLLNQTYPNIFIYLSDDCSTDGTNAICELYAQKDKRIIYSQTEKNTGGIDNHLKVLKVATTDYFMFARGHEIFSPTLIEDGVKVLEKEKNVILAFATPKWIDEENNIMANKHFSYYDTKGMDVVIRCAFALWGRPEYFYGLMRKNEIRKIKLFNGFLATDALTMLELALLGGFAHTCTSSRYRRYHYVNETYKKANQRYKKTYSQHINFFDILFPYARTVINMFKAIKKSKIKFSDKIKILLIVIFTAPLRFLASSGKQL